MRAMVLERAGAPLVVQERPLPAPAAGEVRIAIEACAVCRTDLRSVANLTRRDGEEMLALAPAAGVRPHVHRYALEDANAALDDLRAGRFDGTAVLTPRGA